MSDYIPKLGARTRVRGTVYELKPSPSDSALPLSTVLTAELRELEVEQAEHEHQEEASKQKKVMEEQKKRDWRVEQECSKAAFTGAIKTKKLEELCDIAAALQLLETGLKAEKNPQYEGLFNPTHSRKHCLDNSDSTAELPQDTIPPPNPVHELFGYQPQPAHQPLMSRNEHIPEFPPPGYAPLHYPMQHPALQPHPLHILHPHFAPASHDNADL
ncbi:uncharacterized protein EDB91DRAFT_1245846 [Suillus paluster]|uniref:uncharacterized protein n=1 Tax=Suillus paluster TaxID=48578 RepID=UPI001B868845|nr:uncharacterized protein EDB91DRAFT_1245846 [Suillus paluster]KAG1746662.1 hypothetical protein EDB91DRAFT_1245846 [Suillus paluster]